MSITHARKKSKPIDRWLGLGGIVAGIILFLIPKTPLTVMLCCVAIFGLLVHPLWNFWWIENSFIRRCSAIIGLLIALCALGWWTWPVDVLAAELCPHPLRFSVHENRDSTIDLIIHKRWFGKPIWSVALFSKRMPQLARVLSPETATVTSQGWQQSASMEFANQVPVSEWVISIPSDPGMICVNGVPY